jgi:hypothetical protein
LPLPTDNTNSDSEIGDDSNASEDDSDEDKSEGRIETPSPPRKKQRLEYDAPDILELDSDLETDVRTFTVVLIFCLPSPGRFHSK